MRRIPPAHTPTPPAALVRMLLARGAGPEAELRADLAARHPPDAGVVLVGSGTQALTIAIRTLAGEDGEVALPGWGCFDLVSAAVGAGAGVRLYDLDPATLQPEPASLARAAAGAAAGVVVSFFGIPVDPAVLPDAGTRWIHDAAQAHGMRPTALDERVEATVLSFGRGKGWTGLGGGALLVRSERLRAGIDALALAPAPRNRLTSAARGAAQWLFGRPSLYTLPAHLPGLALGETRYHPPRNAHRIAETSLHLLRATRDAADREAGHRRASARELRRALAEAGDRAVVEAIRVDPAADPGYLRLPALDRGRADRESAAPLGILPSYPCTLDAVAPLKPLLRAADPLPGCALLARALLTLPTHSRMSPSDRRRVQRWCTG